MDAGSFFGSQVWSDRKFATLKSTSSGDLRLAWFYVCSGPHAKPRCGLFRLEMEQMAYDLHWDVKLAREAVETMRALGMIDYDEHQGVVCVRNYLAYNKPHAWKNIQGWTTHVATCSPGRVRNTWLKGLRDHCEARGAVFDDVFEEHFAPMISDLREIDALPGENVLELSPPEPPVVDRKPQKNEQVASGEALVAAGELRSVVRQTIEKAIPDRDLHKWAVEIERTVRLDGRSWQQIHELIEALPGDDFWRGVIQSGSGLRRNFDKAYASAVRKARRADPYEEFANGEK